MPRLSQPLLQKELEREATWLRAVESGIMTAHDIHVMSGLSLSQVYRRLKRARENKPREPDVPARPGKEELPWVELTDGTKPPTPHYDLQDDAIEHPPGAFRINNHHGRRLTVQHEDRGEPLPPDPPPSEHKFSPKGSKKAP